MNTYQSQLQALLQASTLTPGAYTPSLNIKAVDHVAVCIGGVPVLLTGPSDDLESVNQAKAFCRSKSFELAKRALGLDGQVTCETVNGNDIQWPKLCEAVVSSNAGEIEAGEDDGDLMTINLSQNRGLTTLLCVNTELARIIDPNAPEMCDGKILPYLAKQSSTTMHIH